MSIKINKRLLSSLGYIVFRFGSHPLSPQLGVVGVDLTCAYSGAWPSPD